MLNTDIMTECFDEIIMQVMRIGVKACTKCGKEKLLTDFPPAKKHKYGKASWCRKCYEQDRIINKDRTTDYLARTRDNRLDRYKQYWAKNKDARNAQKRNRRISNGEIVRSVHRKWVDNNKEKRVDMDKKSFAKRRETISDSYVARLEAASLLRVTGHKFKVCEIPNDHLCIRRQLLKIKRSIKEKDNA